MRLDKRQPRKFNGTQGALCIICGERFGIVDHAVIKPYTFGARVCVDCRTATGETLRDRNRLAPWTRGHTIPDDSLMLMPLEMLKP